MNADIRNKRKTAEGWVVSDKMNKTRVVEVRWSKRDATYGKVLGRSTKLYVHDEKNESRAGDRVKVMSTRPMSRTKCWRLVNVLAKAKI